MMAVIQWRDMMGLVRLGRWALPERCRFCGAAGAAICPACHADLPSHPDTRCRRCGAAVAGGGICGACQKHPPPFDQVHAAFVYAPPLDRAISAWKYGPDLAWTRSLSLAWCAAWATPPPLPQALVPVPLHPRRLRERGFNQAALLARFWGRHYGIPVRHLARRRHDTPHQVGLKEAERRRNLQDAFMVRPLPGHHLAIVDDVFTTGATTAALAEKLKAAGAGRVDVWVLARAERR